MTTHTTSSAAQQAITTPFCEYRALVLDAAAWRLLSSSPHLAELLAEWVEWERRRTARETSNAVSGASDWHANAATPTYAELARRRAVATRPSLTPQQIRAQATASWARVDAWIATRQDAA
ncbi:hypothetical protein VSH64_34410 [Amycolatopsis rhabdoformis]|uniref:Uncharacterized protein n=1 Tax=Amycolatopsis rhabdoformis TaxID=1448059 RepID=A0ABZ1I0H3_9PSEU|nr:hypothetical protein [Amycolatopsis rhabdoformis]WSE27912.1 hypothetical protein VSH64_34410 [Amycolatopsis rhabdoformis]